MFQRLWTWLAAPLLIAGLCGCARGKGPEVDDVAPEVRFENLRFEVFRGAAVEASGTVARARMRRDTSAVAADRLEVQFPPAPGRDLAQLVAARATGNASERWLQLEDGVQLQQADERVDTQRARLDGRDRHVRGDAPVTVRGRGYVLTGPGFVLDPDGRTVRIEGGARLRAGGPAREETAN